MTISVFQTPPPLRQPAATVSTSKSKPQRNLIVWILIAALGLSFIAGVVLGGCAVSNKRKLAWRLVLEIDPKAPDRSAAVRQTVNVIDQRLDALKLANYEVRPEGDPANGRVVINLPAIDDPERVKQIITTWGKLELVHVITPPSPMPVQTYSTSEEAVAALASAGGTEHTRRVLPYTEREEITPSAAKKWVVVESPPIVTGVDLRNAAAVNRTGGNNDYQISFSLKPAAAEKFGAWTGANINQYLGVVLNDEIKSIAFIKSQIFDQGEITGRFTRQSAEDLALVLRAGALPVPVKLVEESTNK
jgi:preprotein translocase subunit SecD